MADSILVSFVIATFNRGSVLVDCLRHTINCGLDKNNFEIIVVDNASTDGTLKLLAAIPEVRSIPLRRNEGPVAKNHGIKEARGEFVVFLDDDAFPLGGAITAMVQHFRDMPNLGAAVFDVMLPDGTREGSAYPDVFIGAATGFRKSVLDQTGHLPAEYFMQAEEYDLSFRILDAGFSIRRFVDMPARHLKTPGARIAKRITQMDVRNNLYLLAKYVPAPLCFSLAADWLARYWMMAEARDGDGRHEHRKAFVAGVAQGLYPWTEQRRRGRRLAPETLEKIFKFEEIKTLLATAQRRHKLQNIVLVDFGKNLLAYYQAARELGINVLAIADDHLGGPGREYRGVPIIKLDKADGLEMHAWVISNMSPTQSPVRAAALKIRTVLPVIDLFDGSEA